MRLITGATLRDLTRLAPNASAALHGWASQVKAAAWTSMAQVASSGTHSPSPIGDDRIVFNIQGNAYRLIVRVDYPRQVLFLHWFGTHAEYDRIDAATVASSFR